MLHGCCSDPKAAMCSSELFNFSVANMRQLLVSSLFVFPCFSLAEPFIDDPSGLIESTFNYEIPENIDMFSPLPWEDIDFPISGTDDPQQNLDLQEASVLSTQIFVADSNSDTLQSQCGPESNWASGKLRARDGEQCKSPAQSTQLNPNVFDSVILPPDSEPKAVSVTSILSEENKKCTPPYIYNVCCNGKPSGFSGAENFLKVWTEIEGCYISIVFSMK